MVGYTLPTAKIDTEKPRLLECDPGANPLDLLFNIAPRPSPEALTTREYSCVGGDITITSPVQSPPPPENGIYYGRRRCAFIGYGEEEIVAAKEDG